MILVHFTPSGQRRMTDLTSIYAGQTAILAGAAPSLREQPIELLDDRGVLTMAMNNAALHFRPTLWVSGDRPECYEPQLLLDPGIMKFGHISHSGVKLDERYNSKPYHGMPNMFFYMGDKDVGWDEYLAPRRGVPWYNNTLMVGIHILYQLGIKRIILAGSDFGFSSEGNPDSDGDMYAHGTSLGDLQRKWNQDLYNSLVHELRRLKPVFERAGLEFMDSSKNSRLAQTYEHISLEKAVALCKEPFPDEPLDPACLPHCSKFAPESIQDHIARWPGHQVVGASPKAQPEQPAMRKVL